MLNISKNQYFWFSIFWFLIIALLSLTPGDYIPPVEFKFISPSTIAHFGFYFILNYTLLGYLSTHKMMLFIYTFITCSLYGTLIEIVQGNLIPGRFYDINDIYLNSFGAIIGTIVYLFIHRNKQ